MLRTRAEGDGVDEGAGNLLGCSLVPQREVIGVEHALLVLRRQEVSEGERASEAHQTHSDSCHDDDDDERHSLIGELINRYKELGPRQAGPRTQEGDLHPFV